jgi:hypothetical protein
MSQLKLSPGTRPVLLALLKGTASKKMRRVWEKTKLSKGKRQEQTDEWKRQELND